MRDDVAALLRDLRELIETERWFGVDFLPRAASTPRASAARAPATMRSVAIPTSPTPAAPASQPAPAAAPLPDPVADLAVGDDPAADLAAVAARIADCRRCRLCDTRTTTVPGEGTPRPELVFVGEGPGADEDRSGRPFVGKAGQLLDRMIAGMGLRREDVFIANIVKCRPPGNRNPEPDEVAACMPYLERQLAILRPRVICTLGNTPLRALTGDPHAGITRQRGTPFAWRGITVVPTFHPSYLLRNDAAKKPAWEDLKQVLALLGRTPPRRD